MNAQVDTTVEQDGGPVDEEVVTAWDDLSSVQHGLLSARDWRGLKEPSGSRDPSTSTTTGSGV